MSLLSEIEGLKGENLCSALLAHLLLRSPDVRARVIRLISDNAPHGPIYVGNQFAVFREAATLSDEPDGKRGRVDLVIETDDAVIGIENKFNAPFQDGQPAGYLKLLSDRAEQLSNIRERTFAYALMVLAPQRREGEVQTKFEEQELADARFLSWEKLTDELERLSTPSPIDAFLVSELTRYAKSQIGSTEDLARLLPHLKRAWSARGTSTQREFMNTFVWSLLDDRVKGSGRYRCASGAGYYGFYLRPRANHVSDELWIGFVERQSTTDGAALSICVRGGPERLPTGPHLEFVPTQPGWSDYGWSCTDVAFDSSDAWCDVRRWAEALMPLNDRIRSMVSGDATRSRRADSETGSRP